MGEMAERSRTLGTQEERDLKKFLKFLSLKVSFFVPEGVFSHSDVCTCLGGDVV